MGLLSNPAANELYIQVSQPNQPAIGAIWSDSSKENPELKVFDGTDWNEQDPVGAIMPWGGAVASIPSGFLICDGAAVSRTTFANLFAAIASAFGDGNGSTTFNVPDLRGKFQRGAGAAAEPGTTGGEDTHALTTAELATHGHGVTDGGHTHTLPVNVFKLAGSGADRRANSTGTDADALSADSNTTGITIDNTGSGTAHENRPSFQEVIYIIKT